MSRFMVESQSDYINALNNRINAPTRPKLEDSDLKNRVEALTRISEILVNAIKTGSVSSDIRAVQEIIKKLNYNPNNPCLK